MAETDSKILALLHNIAKEQHLENYGIKVNPISSGGANYSSILFLATVTSADKDDLHLFIKVAAMGEKMRSSTALKIYEVEKFVYTELKNNIRELEKDHGVPEKNRLRMSKFYGASTVVYEEMLVLENLSARGFECHDRMKSVDWEYATSATTELAKLHALSMALHHYKPDEFNKTKQNLHFEMNSNDFEKFWSSSSKLALSVVREENREKLQKFVDALDFETYWRLYETSKLDVLIHGDFRPSNLMHRRRDDGSVEVVAVDYQTMRSGSPVVDLLYFIFSGTDAEFRAHYYQKLVDHYYSELSAALTRLALNPDEKYSKEDFELELKEKLSFGLTMSMFILPVVTVEAENAPKVSEEMEMTDFAITKTSSLYLERLNGVVDDYVRWGIL